MRIGHLHMRKNKRVIVFLRTGETAIGKYVKFDKDRVYIQDNEPIRTNKIRTISYYKKLSYE